jgi:hypothetical protein
MSSMIENEILQNGDKNEIFYSLSHFDIYNIQKRLSGIEDNEYLNVIIKFSDIEIDKIYKLLSTTYKIQQKEEIIFSIWETFLCNKILQKLQSLELIYFSQNLEKEKNILSSFDIYGYIKYSDKRTSISTINQIVNNQISKKVRIHYFPDGTMIPIELQKVINQVFGMDLTFTNMLYTIKDSLYSHYIKGGQWLKIEEDYKEIWESASRISKENFSWN